MMPLTRKPSPRPSYSPNKPTLHPLDPKAVRWSALVTCGDSDGRENQNGINDDYEFEAGESLAQGDEENQQQLAISSKTPEYKINSWARSKLRSLNFSWSSRMSSSRSLRAKIHQAALKGDWKTAKQMEDMNPGVLTMVISERSETVLHIATRVKKTVFVEKLVELLDEHDLAFKNKYGNTALCIAAASGAVDIAKLLVRKYKALPLIRGSGNATPVLIAARYKHKDMVSYLLSQTPVYGLAIQEQMELLLGAISADYYDIALLILEWNQLLTLQRDFHNETPLHIMARKSGAIGKKNKPTMWESYMNKWSEHIYKKKMMQIQAYKMVELMWSVVLDKIPENELSNFVLNPSSMLHEAARVGNVEFLKLLTYECPDLAWNVDGERKSIFHVAVENRQASVFSLIYEMGEFLDYLPYYFDEENMSLLELAAKMADPSHLNRVSGAAFQMHRELLWFKLCRSKQVEKIVELTMRRTKGKQSPRELFTQEHKYLVEKGEGWMKQTANSCMLVATLITTVVFAAIFSVPGGYENNINIAGAIESNNKTGTPLCLYHKWFTVFVISDAIALISSSTSILVFLSILTSRCVEEDFLSWLPLKLVCGLGTLFLSVVTMVLAFSSTFFLFYGKDTACVPLLVAGMATVPVYCFGVLLSRLLLDALAALRATYYLYSKNSKRILF